MSNFESLDLLTLYSMLHAHNLQYHKMINDGLDNGFEFENCRKNIKSIEAAIEIKKKMPAGSIKPLHKEENI